MEIDIFDMDVEYGNSVIMNLCQVFIFSTERKLPNVPFFFNSRSELQTKAVKPLFSIIFFKQKFQIWMHAKKKHDRQVQFLEVCLDWF